jgi:hypothetical protein
MSRLEQIKARKIRAVNKLYERNELRGTVSTVLEEDIDWLIARVERLERIASLAKRDLDANEQCGEHPRMSLSLMEALVAGGAE